MISISDILKSISDDKSLVLFDTIALSNGESQIQIRKMGLTTKQYYSRISNLMKADLIRRKNGRYSLTVLGRVVYEAQTTIGKSLKYYWKLKAVESIGMSHSVTLPKDDLSKIVDTLIDNQQIKDIVMKTLFSNVDTIEEYGFHQGITSRTERTRIRKVSVKQIDPYLELRVIPKGDPVIGH